MKLEGKLLYQDSRIQICQAGIPDEHEVLVDGELYCYIDRGILREWAEADSERIRMGLMAINEPFLDRLEQARVSLDCFGWALSKARIKELEKERDYFVQESIKAAQR